MDSPTKLAVLVVDDSFAVRTLLGVLVRKQGFDTHLAGYGEKAVALYREHQATIALALLDVQMPGLDGPATLSELQKINPDIPCAFVSSNLGSYTRRELFERGPFAVLAKPINLKQLASVLDAVRSFSSWSTPRPLPEPV